MVLYSGTQEYKKVLLAYILRIKESEGDERKGREG